jgi:1,4-alpha-glucan branching enzyme
MSSARSAELLFVGRPVPEKGLADVLSALSRLRHHRWHLTIVGEIPPGIHIDAFGSAVTSLGTVRNREIARIMAVRDILLVPSHYETFGNVALEGLACGMVVLASYTGGLKTLIQHGETGFHFRPGDVADLTQILGFAIDNLTELTAIRQNARDASVHYSWDEIVLKTSALLARYA